MEFPRREVIGWGIASGLVISGVVTLLIVRNLSTDFGYIAPAPLLGGAYIPGAYETTRTLNLVAAGVVLIGLVAGGFAAGLRAGRKGLHSSPRKELIRWAAAAGLVITGVTLLIVGMNRPTSFGWFAYAPLSETTYMPGTPVTTIVITVAGMLFLILGLLATGFLSGLRVTHRGAIAPSVKDRGNAGAE